METEESRMITEQYKRSSGEAISIQILAAGKKQSRPAPLGPMSPVASHGLKVPLFLWSTVFGLGGLPAFTL